MIRVRYSAPIMLPPPCRCAVQAWLLVKFPNYQISRMVPLMPSAIKREKRRERSTRILFRDLLTLIGLAAQRSSRSFLCRVAYGHNAPHPGPRRGGGAPRRGAGARGRWRAGHSAAVGPPAVSAPPWPARRSFRWLGG